MNISGIVKTSLIDYPSLLSCVLFVPGCNYSCFYCHNRSLIDGTHIVLSPQYVKAFLQKRVGLLDGVVISGGEPTLQSGLVPFLRMVKDLGYQIKLDTNGSYPEIIAELLQLKLCDYFAVDYKAPASDYLQICGGDADAQKVIESITLLCQNTVPFEIRTTVIPQLEKDALMKMATEIPRVPRYVLNRYRMPEKYLMTDQEKIEMKPYSQEEIQSLVDCIREFQPNAII